MNTVSDLVKYLYLHYPFKMELSKARLVKMIYLIDWRSCILYQKQITDIRWYFNHYGPYVSEIIGMIRKDNDFEINSIPNMFGEMKEFIVLRNEKCIINISKDVEDIANYVIDNTANLKWEQFINLIYSTYPIVKQPRYSYLDLVQLSKEYEQLKKSFKQINIKN